MKDSMDQLLEEASQFLDEDSDYQCWSETIEKQNQQHQDEEMKNESE